jgi:hypothetical protein
MKVGTAQMGFFVYDSDGVAQPMHILEPPGSVNHWPTGLSHGRFVPNAKEWLIAGSPRHTVDGEPWAGRVVILKVQ